MSMVRLFLLSMLFVTIISTAIIGYLWINHEYNRFDEDSGKLREEYIESQKDMIKNETFFLKN